MNPKPSPGDLSRRKGRWVAGATAESELLTEALAVTHTSLAAFGARLGLPKNRIDKMHDPEVPSAAVPMRLLWMGGDVGDALFAGVQRLRAERDRDHFGEDHLARLVYLSARLHAVIDCYAQLVSAGVEDASQRSEVRRCLQDARVVLAGLDDALAPEREDQ